MNRNRLYSRKNKVLRYGAYAAFVDLAETKTDLLASLRYVDQAVYRQERQPLQRILLQRQDYHRFCHNLDIVVKELEAEWQVAVETAPGRLIDNFQLNLP